MSRSANWETAYKGKTVKVAVAKRPSRRENKLNNDLSEGRLILFYTAVAIGVVSYFVHINQDAIRDLFMEKAPQAKEVSKMVTK